jgi:hypothetical protein
VPLSVGNKVYQSGSDSDNMPIIMEYVILNIKNDGRAEVQFTEERYGYSNRYTDFVFCKNLHTDAKALIEMHLANDTKVLERLPSRIARWRELQAKL